MSSAAFRRRVGIPIFPGCLATRTNSSAAFDDYHSELRQVVRRGRPGNEMAGFRSRARRGLERRTARPSRRCVSPVAPLYGAGGRQWRSRMPPVLARCIADIGSTHPDESFRWFEANRMPRTSRVQRISVANTWLREPTNVDWLFCYDACAVPLEPPPFRFPCPL